MTTKSESPAPAPSIPDDVLAYLHAYGDSRADDDGLSGLRIAEAILAIRRWAAALAATPAPAPAVPADTTPLWMLIDGAISENEALRQDIEHLRAALATLLEHEGERVLNGIGLECDSDDLAAAKRTASELLDRDPQAPQPEPVAWWCQSVYDDCEPVLTNHEAEADARRESFPDRAVRPLVFGDTAPQAPQQAHGDAEGKQS